MKKTLLTRKYDDNVLGTADYLAPEQADDSHAVDVRADIYSLGGTFYFLLTGKTPFGEGTVPQKLMWHRTRRPKPVSDFRGDVPDGVQAVIDKMMSKDPEAGFKPPRDYRSAGTLDSERNPAPGGKRDAAAKPRSDGDQLVTGFSRLKRLVAWQEAMASDWFASAHETPIELRG